MRAGKLRLSIQREKKTSDTQESNDLTEEPTTEIQRITKRKAEIEKNLANIEPGAEKLNIRSLNYARSTTN